MKIVIDYNHNLWMEKCGTLIRVKCPYKFEYCNLECALVDLYLDDAIARVSLCFYEWTIERENFEYGVKTSVKNKALKVIRSCKTAEQLKGAEKYLVKILTHPNFADLFSLEDVEEIINTYRLKKKEVAGEEGLC